MLGFLTMRFQEVKGHWPLMKAKNRPEADALSHRSESDSSAVEAGKTGVTEKSAEVAA